MSTPAGRCVAGKGCGGGEARWERAAGGACHAEAARRQLAQGRRTAPAVTAAALVCQTPLRPRPRPQAQLTLAQLAQLGADGGAAVVAAQAQHGRGAGHLALDLQRNGTRGGGKVTREMGMLRALASAVRGRAAQGSAVHECVVELAGGRAASRSQPHPRPRPNTHLLGQLARGRQHQALRAAVVAAAATAANHLTLILCRRGQQRGGWLLRSEQQRSAAQPYAGQPS